MGQDGEIITNAYQWLSDALIHLDGDLLLTSPYLTTDICQMIAKSVSGGNARGVVVTTLDPSAVAGGYLMVQGLKKLLDAGIEIRHVERLHAKCFIVGTQAMLGSANLTGAGLGSSANRNRELGVMLDDVQRDQAQLEISGWPARIVNHDDLDELLQKSKELTRPTPAETTELTADSALRKVERLLIDARDPNRELWVKLEYGEPALDGWREPSWFASPKKGKPSFKPGDLVFICAKDTQDCYAIVEVTEEPEYQPADYVEFWKSSDPAQYERWPWINRTRPRLVPDQLMALKRDELGISGQALQNGHVRLKFDQFTAGVRALARLATE